MSSACQFDQAIVAALSLHGCSWRAVVRQPRVTYRVGKGQQIISARFRLFLDGQSDHLPAPGRRQGLGVRLAKVIAVRLDLICQRSENRGGVSIGIGQCRSGRIGASCSRTATRPHLPDGTPETGSIVGRTAVSERSEPLDTSRAAERSSAIEHCKRQRAEQSNTVLTCPVGVATVMAAACADLCRCPTL